MLMLLLKFERKWYWI